MSSNKKIRVGITQGDTNGIGLEVVLKTLATPEFTELCTPIVYSSNKIISYHRKANDLPYFQTNNIRYARDAREGNVNVLDLGGEEVKIELGEPSKQAGQAAFRSLEAAVSDLKNGQIDVLVTAPINKDNIQSEQFTFPGHTEYLEASLGDGGHALMTLCNPLLRVALVTNHMPIAKVPAAITTELVGERLRTFNASLQRDFGVERPRIAVLSLNPHAGENGLLGSEEQTVIKPAIDAAYDERILAFGPYAADGFFGSGHYRQFDGVLAMYHDQGLASFKALAMNEGVNFTAGLPFVRTSPDHGTGYDIAGKNMANETSLRQAIYVAIDVYRNRKKYDEAHVNPLRKQYFDRGKDNVVLDLTKDENDE